MADSKCQVILGQIYGSAASGTGMKHWMYAQDYLNFWSALLYITNASNSISPNCNLDKTLFQNVSLSEHETKKKKKIQLFFHFVLLRKPSQENEKIKLLGIHFSFSVQKCFYGLRA